MRTFKGPVPRRGVGGCTWGYVIYAQFLREARILIIPVGAGRITSVDGEGRTYVSDIKGPRDGSAPDTFT